MLWDAKGRSRECWRGAAGVGPQQRRPSRGAVLARGRVCAAVHGTRLFAPFWRVQTGSVADRAPARVAPREVGGVPSVRGAAPRPATRAVWWGRCGGGGAQGPHAPIRQPIFSLYFFLWCAPPAARRGVQRRCPAGAPATRGRPSRRAAAPQARCAASCGAALRRRRWRSARRASVRCRGEAVWRCRWGHSACVPLAARFLDLAGVCVRLGGGGVVVTAVSVSGWWEETWCRVSGGAPQHTPAARPPLTPLPCRDGAGGGAQCRAHRHWHRANRYWRRVNRHWRRATHGRGAGSGTRTTLCTAAAPRCRCRTRCVCCYLHREGADGGRSTRDSRSAYLWSVTRRLVGGARGTIGLRSPFCAPFFLWTHARRVDGRGLLCREATSAVPCVSTGVDAS